MLYVIRKPDGEFIERSVDKDPENSFFSAKAEDETLWWAWERWKEDKGVGQFPLPLTEILPEFYAVCGYHCVRCKIVEGTE